MKAMTVGLLTTSGATAKGPSLWSGLHQFAFLRTVGLAMMALAVAVPALARDVVPELDPSIAASGLAALVGGVLVLKEWRRRK